jgi:ubiquinone/menaquinone biosynthesis C-methylase UbiE
LPVITACLLLFLRSPFFAISIIPMLKIVSSITRLFKKESYTASAPAYDIWAGSYDDQPDNLMLALDEALFTELLNTIKIKGISIVDVGCGTGRHWKKIMVKEPQQLTGFDVSENMLTMLQQKFPQAITHIIQNDSLQPLADNSCDLLISTLTIAHIENAAAALQEWNRVLKPGGCMIITDYHPAALEKGAKRTFKHGDTLVAIKNYVHTIADITTTAKQLKLSSERLIEKNINDSMRPYYEKQGALAVYEAWKGTPVIYGLLLVKENDTV